MRPTIVFSSAILFMVSVIGFAHLRSRLVLRREVEQAARREGSLPKRILWICMGREAAAYTAIFSCYTGDCQVPGHCPVVQPQTPPRQNDNEHYDQ